MNKKVLEVKRLYKNFGKKKLFQDLSFTINKGEVVCFIGRNGVGKTTLFNIILNSISKNFGDVLFEKDYEKNIGFLYQERNFNDPLKFKTFLKTIKSSFEKDEKKIAFFQYLYDFLEIQNFDKVPLSSLSGGQKQLASIFQTIVHLPWILFLDEYSNNLDTESLVKVKALLKKLVTEYQMTIVLASHKIEEIENFVDKIYIIDNKGIEEQIVIKNFSTKKIEKLFERI